jgi:LasA protease
VSARSATKRADRTGRWRFGTVVVPPARGAEAPEGWLFLAHAGATGWTVGLDGTAAFDALAAAAPEDVLPKAERTLLVTTPATLAATDTGLRLPWATGVSWTMTGGPHGFAGSNTPYSSADFAGGDQRVRAAGAGAVYTMCSSNRGWLRVVHGGGWSTDYYHLWSNITPADGSRVAAGAFLGYTGTDISCGGAASARHVHFSLRRNGAYVTLNDKTVGGWTFHTGQPYGGYATHAGTARYPGQPLYNYGALGARQGVIDANGGTYVNLRSGPGRSYRDVGDVADGTVVTIACTARGSTETGRYGSTDLWDRLSSGSWVSDAFVYTGTDGPVAGPC